MQFEWNPEKAAANLKKHGVSFEEMMKSILLKKNETASSDILRKIVY